MNILHIAPYYPSVNAMHAGGVAMGHEIETLKKLGHKVYIVTFVQEEYDSQLYLKKHTEDDDCVVLDKKRKIKNILRHPFCPLFFATRMDSLFLKKIITSIEKNNIQAVHLEYSSMLWCLKLKDKYPYLKFVSVLHDVTTQSYERKKQIERSFLKRMLLSFETKRIYAYEKRYLNKCDEIVSFSDKDQKLISKYYDLASKRINTYFGMEKIVIEKQLYAREADDYYSICFVGQMGRKENEEAAVRLISIFERVSLVNKKLYIIGAKPSDYLRSFAKNNIVITGFVDNIDAFIIRKCDIACFPLTSGAGIKIKVLEATALGIPVITNEIGSEGIDEEYDYLIPAETDEEFVKQINELVDKRENNLHGFYEEFNWSITESVLAEIYGDNRK